LFLLQSSQKKTKLQNSKAQSYQNCHVVLTFTLKHFANCLHRCIWIQDRDTSFYALHVSTSVVMALCMGKQKTSGRKPGSFSFLKESDSHLVV